MTWNYRVIEYEIEGETLYKVCEVYYDEAGNPNGWIENKNPFYHLEEADSVEWICKKILEAYEKPVLVQSQDSLT